MKRNFPCITFEKGIHPPKSLSSFHRAMLQGNQISNVDDVRTLSPVSEVDGTSSMIMVKVGNTSPIRSF